MWSSRERPQRPSGQLADSSKALIAATSSRPADEMSMSVMALAARRCKCSEVAQPETGSQWQLPLECSSVRRKGEVSARGVGPPGVIAGFGATVRNSQTPLRRRGALRCPLASPIASSPLSQQRPAARPGPQPRSEDRLRSSSGPKV